MSITPQTSSRVPVAAVLVAGLGSQVVDDALTTVLPPAVVLSGLIAILLTAGAARVVTRSRTGADVARTGVGVGIASAVIGLLFGGLGLIAILLAGVTVVAGVAGAAVGRRP